MRSSDQRYHSVQRTKRDPREWEQWSRALVVALRDVRTGTGDWSAVQAAIQGGAAEFNHLLLACGRTATDFRRNYRRGSPNFHTVWANHICPIETLTSAKLDGFAVMRLSREQTKNVKLRWAKLREQDVLIHDPQGVHWAKVMACHVDGERDEHLGTLEDLRDRGISLVLENQERSEEAREARLDKEMWRSLRHFAHGINDGEPEPGPEVHRDHALRRFAIAQRIHETGVYKVPKGPAAIRLELEESLIVAEAWLETGNTDQAIWDGDTSQRHCSAARLRERMAAVERGFAERGLTDELAAVAERI